MIVIDEMKLEDAIEKGIKRYYESRKNRYAYLHGHDMREFILLEIEKVNKK